LKYIR
jgi:hypothetical protein